MWQKIRKIRKKTAKMFGVRFRFVRDPIPSPASVQSHMRLPCLPQGEYGSPRRSELTSAPGWSAASAARSGDIEVDREIFAFETHLRMEECLPGRGFQ
jgi:hypothetical protein